MKTLSGFLKNAGMISLLLITHLGHTQHWEWAKAAHAVASITNDVATDAAENIYMIHYDVGGSVAVTKMDRHGTLLWDKNYGCCNVAYSNLRIAVDAAQNVYIMGGYYVSIQFGNITLQSDPTSASVYTFLTKLDAQGNVVWAKNASGPTVPWEGRDMVVDRQGNIVVTGSVKGTAYIGNTTFPSNVNTLSSYVSKYNSNGQVLWVQKASGTESAGRSLDTDDQGNIYAIGFYQGSIQWGNLSLPYLSSENSGSYFIKISAGGNVLWGKKMDRTMSIATDAVGSSYLLSDFSGTVNLGNGITLANAKIGDIVVARYDTHGNPLWAKLAGSTVFISGNDLDIDQYGNCYVVGRFISTATFDTKSFNFPPQISSIGFAARYLPNGLIDWAEPIIPKDYTYAERVSTSAIGKCYIVVDNLESGHSLKFGSDLIFTDVNHTDVIAKLDGMAQKNSMIVFQRDKFLCFPCFSFDPDPILDYEYRFGSERVGIEGATYRKVSDNDNQDEILWREDYLEIKLHDELPAGTYYFQLRAMLEDGSATPWTEALAFEVEGNIRSALIYPNPVKDKLTIAYQATEQETLSLTLYDRNGRILLEENKKVRGGKNVLELVVPMIKPEVNPLTLQLQSKLQGTTAWQLMRE